MVACLVIRTGARSLELKRLALDRRAHLSIDLDGHDVAVIKLYDESAGPVERGIRSAVAITVEFFVPSPPAEVRPT